MLSPADQRSREHFGLPYLPAVFARNFLVRSLAELGEFGEGSVRAEEGMQIADTVDQAWERVVAYFGAGVLHLRKEEGHTALSALAQALSLCQSAHISEWLGSTAAYVVSTHALLGQVPEAIAVLEQETKQRAATGNMGRLSILMGGLSEGYLLVNRIQDALDHALRALDLARTHKEQGHEAWALRLLGEIHAHPENQAVDQAETSYQQALALATKLGMRPLQAHCHFGLGKLYRQIGRKEQAQIELTAAFDLYRAMDMTFWASQLEAILAASL